MPNPDVKPAMVDVSHIVSQTPIDAPAEPAAAPVEPVDTAPADTTPPAEPAVEPKKEDTHVDLSLDTATAEHVEVAQTGYPEFDAVGKLMGEKGMENANEIMETFLETGELSLEDKAAMIASLGESVAAMAFKQMESTADGIISEAKADSQKSMDYANTKFGGEDAAKTWEEIQAYVRTPEAGFSEADLATMNDMLAAGGLQAQLVIDKVHAVYTQDSGVSLPGALLEGDSASTGLTFEPISRIDYTAEMGKAVGKYGEDSPQVRDLNARRTKSMQLGY